MRFRSTTAGLLALPLALTTLASTDGDELPEGCYVAVEAATEDDDDLLACERQVWFTESTTKVSNLASQGLQPNVGWGDEEPTASVTSGAGCGALALGASRTAGEAEAAALVVEGSFTGVIDRLDVDLHLLYPQRPVYTPDDITIELIVDGVPILTPNSQRIVAVRPAPNASTGAAFQQDFVITGLATVLDAFGIDMSPAAEHTVEVRFRPWFVDSGNWTYVFGTTEVPSNITFNAVVPDPAAAVLSPF
jgi:hypothetical protein